METKKHPVILLIVAILLISPIVSHGQKIEIEVQQDWWFNIPSSPLIIQPQRTWFASHSEKHQYGYGLKNVSSRTIHEYFLGCVEKQHDKVRFLMETRASYPEGGLLPGHFVSDVQELNSPSVEELKAQSVCQDGKIAVTEVRFTDGTNWHGNHLPWDEAKRNDK